MDIQEGTDRINALLQQNKHQEALEAAHAVRDQLQKSGDNSEAGTAQLAEINDAIAKLEAAGYKVTRIELPKMPKVSAASFRPSRHMQILIAVVVVVGLSYLIYSHMRYSAYVTDTEPVLAEMEKMEAATEVGINYMRYSDKLPDVQLAMNKFKEKYGDQSEAKYESYKDITKAMGEYTSAMLFWKMKIDDVGDKGVSDRSISQSFTDAGDDITAAKKAIKEGK